MCKEVSTLKIDQAQGGVSYTGDDVSKQKTSLRRKIYDHKNSMTHIRAGEIVEESKKDRLKKGFKEQHKGQFETTERLIRSAYAVAKNNRPYVSYQEYCELQQANGLDIGTCLHSRYAGTAMIDSIAEDMLKILCDSLIKNNQRVSIMLDESTTVSRKSCLVVYIRSACPQKKSDESECFAILLGLVEPPSLRSDDITKCTLELLAKHGFTDSYLASNLVGACSDGASVMLGKHSGVLTKLKQKYPKIILWHCMCHRVELAIGDAVKSVTQVNHVKSFLDKLYSIFSQSPKAQRELEECAAQVHSELVKIGRVLDVCWVASSFRGLQAVWKSYSALHKFTTDSDTATNSKHKAVCEGLRTILASHEFVHNLAVMLDALEAISDLSKSLQRENCSLGEAYSMVTRTIRD